MSDKRISELVELTTLEADDELPVVDADANATKRITAANLSKFPSNITIPNGGTIGSASDSDAITIDATGNVALSQALQLGDSTALTNLGADQFRLTADATSNGTLTAWERVDEASSGKVGSGVTESSGFFSVPNNGVWLITVQAMIYTRDDLGDNFASLTLEVGGSAAANIQVSNPTNEQHIHTMFMQSLHRLTPSTSIRLSAGSLVDSKISGASTNTLTGITFVRVGDI